MSLLQSQCLISGPNAADRRCQVPYAREQVWPKEFAWLFDQIVRSHNVVVQVPEEKLTPEESTIDAFSLWGENRYAQQYVFWDGDDAASVLVAPITSKLLSEDLSRSVSFQAAYDNVPLSGILHSETRASPRAIDAPSTLSMRTYPWSMISSFSPSSILPA